MAVSQEVATVVPLLSVAWVGTLVAAVELVRGESGWGWWRERDTTSWVGGSSRLRPDG